MGIPVLILGESGSGKSRSIKNLNPNEVAIFNVSGKMLPFKTKFPNIINTSDYDIIRTKLKENKFKTYIIDDSQYLMAFELFDKVNVSGYGKFTDIAVHFKNLLTTILKQTSPDTIVYFLHHSEETANGKIKIKTVGKMLDEQLTLEGLFGIVLLARAVNGKHTFLTQSDGSNPCKSPEEMFDKNEIENDLKIVNEKIREYYEI